MTDDISEEHLSNGRTRRSAAVASSKAWHTLMPHKKGIFSDNEEGEIQEVERAEHSRKKRKQLAGADPPSAIVAKKRGRTSKMKVEFLEQNDLLPPPPDVDALSQGPAKKSPADSISEGKPPAKAEYKAIVTPPVQQQMENRTHEVDHMAKLAERVIANSETLKRWTAEDDVALIAAVTHVCDLKAVYNYMNFSRKYSLAELEERWYSLLYHEEMSRAARKRMDAIGRERIRQIQSKIPFSVTEEDIIRAIPSSVTLSPSFFERVLDQNRAEFHHARTSKVLEDYWRDLKYYNLLVDQKPMHSENELLDIERNLDLYTLTEGDANLPLDIEERHITRSVVVSEREAQEWENVYIKSIAGVSNTLQMTPDTVAVVKGRCVTFDIRKHKALIGRSTRLHRVDVNLSLEGPSARISRKQALMRLYDNNEFVIYNIGKRPIYVDGVSVVHGDKARLNNNSIIEIALIRLHFIRNENYKKRVVNNNTEPEEKAPIKF